MTEEESDGKMPEAVIVSFCDASIKQILNGVEFQ